MDQRSKRGFTLAELLIVVAIIAVLVAVAIPVFSTQLEKSREAVDIANIRSALASVITVAMTENITQDGPQDRDGLSMYFNPADPTIPSDCTIMCTIPTKQNSSGWEGNAPDFGSNLTVTNAPPEGCKQAEITYNVATGQATVEFQD